ncbi:hypothetical protein LC048_14830 [Mesobacillus subterraneus]|uniref:hypothetical protein n=1 Tax=Mesobacillus subterraneus TaxID=285983 RepID=UPI001CFE6805|nr:hypothetical protein [Mesobacillus subterraneus]WLR53787.1 hypothetical protein LC048_14830 [Mesobacillus subterraneus]
MKDYEGMFEQCKRSMTIEELHRLKKAVYDIAITCDYLKDYKKASYFYTLSERINTYIKLERN